MRIKGERERERVGRIRSDQGWKSGTGKGEGVGGGAGRTKKDNMIDMSNMSVSSHHQ